MELLPSWYSSPSHNTDESFPSGSFLTVSHLINMAVLELGTRSFSVSVTVSLLWLVDEEAAGWELPALLLILESPLRWLRATLSSVSLFSLLKFIGLRTTLLSLSKAEASFSDFFLRRRDSPDLAGRVSVFEIFDDRLLLGTWKRFRCLRRRVVSSRWLSRFFFLFLDGEGRDSSTIVIVVVVVLLDDRDAFDFLLLLLVSSSSLLT